MDYFQNRPHFSTEIESVTNNEIFSLYSRSLHQEIFSKKELTSINAFIKGKNDENLIFKFQEINPGDSRKYLSISFSGPHSDRLINEAKKKFSLLLKFVSVLFQNRFIPKDLRISEPDQTKLNSIILNSLKILGFKGIKETTKYSDDDLEYLSLVAINTGNDPLKKDISLFPILISCSNFKVSLKFILTKDTKWFICEKRFLGIVEEFLNNVSPGLHSSEKVVYDSNSNGVCLMTEFAFFGRLGTELATQKEFLSRFFYSLSTFTLISRYMYSLFHGIPVDINAILKELDTSRRDKEFNLNDPKIDEPRIIYPENYEKVTFSSSNEEFEKEVEIIEKLKQSSRHFYWIDIDKAKKTIKYPKYNGLSISQFDLHQSELMKSLINFFIQTSKTGYFLENFFENLMIMQENSTLVFYLKHNIFRHFFRRSDFNSEFNLVFQKFIEESSEKIFQLENQLKEITLTDFDTFDELSMTGRLLNEDVKLMNIGEFTALEVHIKEEILSFGYIKVNSQRMVVFRRPIIT